jgi:hypothetical protein
VSFGREDERHLRGVGASKVIVGLVDSAVDREECGLGEEPEVGWGGFRV